MTARITVLGIGNIILRDEGFGVRVMEELRDKSDFGDDVQFLDGGTLGMELLVFLMETECLLVFDAVDGEETDDELYVFRDDEVEAHFQEKLAVHELGIQDVLALLKLTGKAPKRVTVIGAAPKDLSVGTELSAELKALVPKAAKLGGAEVEKWLGTLEPPEIAWADEDDE